MEGVQSQISIGQESAWGTAVTPTVSVPVAPSDGIQPIQEPVGVEVIKGTAPKNKDFFAGKRTLEGSFELPLYPQAAGYLLKSALGSVSTEAIEDGVKKHTIVEALTKPSLTIEQAVGGTVTKRYAGVIAKTLSVEAKVGESVLLKTDLIGKTLADATKITAAYETTRPFNWTDITTLSIGGTDIKAKCEEFAFEYTNNEEVFHGFGNYEPQHAYATQSELTGSMTLILDSATKAYINNLLATTQQEIILEMQGDLAGATVKNTLKLTISKCAFTKVETKLDFEYTAISLEFTAREDSTNGLVKVELTNGVISY